MTPSSLSNCTKVCAIILMVLASCTVRPSSGCCSPPTGVWCEYQQLPEVVPFSVTQEVWWNEYFLFNATTTTTIGFKFYAGMSSLEYFSVIVAENYCPNFGDVVKLNLTFVYSYGTASVLVNVTEGQSYVIFGHMSGNNYTLAGCDGPCPQLCPGDCTNPLQGVCDVPTGQCFCYAGWAGDDCSNVANNTNGTAPPTPHHKIPFGSEAVFIFVITGLPTAVLVTAVTGTLIYLAYRKKERRLRKEKQPLLDPASPSANGVNGHHHHHLHNGKDKDYYQDSVSLSPAFPPSPQYDRVPSPVTSSSPPSAPPITDAHRSPEEQQSLHRRNNNKY